MASFATTGMSSKFATAYGENTNPKSKDQTMTSRMIYVHEPKVQTIEYKKRDPIFYALSGKPNLISGPKKIVKSKLSGL